MVRGKPSLAELKATERATTVPATTTRKSIKNAKRNLTALPSSPSEAYPL